MVALTLIGKSPAIGQNGDHARLVAIEQMRKQAFAGHTADRHPRGRLGEFGIECAACLLAETDAVTFIALRYRRKMLTACLEMGVDPGSPREILRISSASKDYSPPGDDTAG